MPSEEMLQKYAEVAVKIGVGIEPGDRLLVRSFLDAVDLTRMIVDEAYRSGAENVSEVSVYGIREDGAEEPIISNGEWGFSV